MGCGYYVALWIMSWVLCMVLAPVVWGLWAMGVPIMWGATIVVATVFLTVAFRRKR
jgi:hypothetical protein